MDLPTLDEIVDQLLLSYYKEFLEEDGVAEPLLGLCLDAIPAGKKPGYEA